VGEKVRAPPGLRIDIPTHGRTPVRRAPDSVRPNPVADFFFLGARPGGPFFLVIPFPLCFDMNIEYC